MPSIAQQDYIIITIEDVTNPTEAEQLEIGKLIDNGTVFDAIIETGEAKARILAVDRAIESVLIARTEDYAQQDSPYIAIPFICPSEMD